MSNTAATTTMKRFANEGDADAYMRSRNAASRKYGRNDWTVVVEDENGAETVAMSLREAIALGFAYRWAA